MVLLWSPGSPWWAWSFAVRGRALKGKEHDEPFFTFALVSSCPTPPTEGPACLPKHVAYADQWLQPIKGLPMNAIVPFVGHCERGGACFGGGRRG